MSNCCVYYLPINDSDVLLEGCETLLKSLVQRIIERYVNGYSNHTDEPNVPQVKVTKIEIHFA